MPFGLPPDVYIIEVKATSQTDPSYSVVKQVRLTVSQTFEVVVENLDMSGQTFSAGESCRTGKWEVQNRGNMDDQFSLETGGSDSIIVELLVKLVKVALDKLLLKNIPENYPRKLVIKLIELVITP